VSLRYFVVTRAMSSPRSVPAACISLVAAMTSVGARETDGCRGCRSTRSQTAQPKWQHLRPLDDGGSHTALLEGRCGGEPADVRSRDDDCWRGHDSTVAAEKS